MMYDNMVWGMGIWHFVAALITLLVLAALIKYVFFR